MKLIVGITGASGAELGVKFLKHIPKNKDLQLEVVFSKKAPVVMKKEINKNINLHNNKNIGASIASGSFQADAMIIAPCSTNTLSKIACGISDNLITRSASVMLKENKKLVLAVREMPFSAIVLENMLKLSRCNVIIAPPVLGYYSNNKTIDEMEKFIFGKWLDCLDIENDLFQRWKG